MHTPPDRKYTKSHEWVRDDGDGCVTVGITDFAQDQVGELIYVELPQPGRMVAQDEACAVVESSKAASDIYAPVAGEVIETNDALVDAPQTVNESPYEKGWLFRLKIVDGSALDTLLDDTGYAAVAVAS